MELVRKKAKEAGAEDAVIATHWAEGGKGAVDLGQAVMEACKKPVDFKFLYPLEWSIKEKIEKIAKEIYGADGVSYSEEAEKKIALYTRQVCHFLSQTYGFRDLINSQFAWQRLTFL